MALKILRKRIAEGTPRTITPAIKNSWMFFTDTCFHEDGSGGLGVVSYIDNEGAKFSLIRGCSKSPVLARICHWVATLCEKQTTLPWFSHVSSPLNIADASSRMQSSVLLPASFSLEVAQVRRAYLSIRDRVIRRCPLG